MHKLRLFCSLVPLVGSVVAAGCSRSSGTYVVLDFDGTVSKQAPIRSVELDLDLGMGTSAAHPVFTAPDGGDITLSANSATLKIQHGSGHLDVVARAKSAEDKILGTGTGSGEVEAGKTTHITVTFTGSGGEVGLDGGTGAEAGSDGRTDASGDVEADSPADRAGPDGNGGVDIVTREMGGNDGAGGASPVDGAAGTGGAGGTGGTAGPGGAGGGAQDAGPDVPSLVTDGGSGLVTIISEPSLVDFGYVSVGTTSAPLPTKIRNVGSAPTPSLVVKLSQTPSPFSIEIDACSRKVLAPQDTCTISMVFSPTTLDLVSNSLSVTAGTVTGTDIRLSGTGVAKPTPMLSLQPPQGTFGVVDVGNSGSVTFTVTNTGSSSASALRVGYTGGPAFQLTSDQCSNQGLAIGASCTFAVTFMPTAAGPANGNVTVQSLDLGTPVTATLTGTGRAPGTVHKVGRNAFGLAGHSGSLISPDNVLSCYATSCPPVAYPDGSQIALSAVPDVGFSFIGWTDGPCHNTSPDCKFTLTNDVIVSATFGPRAYMFVTSTTVVPGNLGGLAGADEECKKHATVAGLPGTYRAWLSSSEGPASSRVGNGGWVRVDGRPFARNIATLGGSTNQVVYYPPRIDELGDDLGPGHLMVATGGNILPGEVVGACSDYTDPSGTLNAGDVIAGSGTWAFSQVMTNGCSAAVRLYCFRSDLTGDITPLPLPGRHVFVTASAWSPYVGIAKADGFCKAEASAAGLPSANTFIALLATSTASAASRLTPGGIPWKRVDDVFVFNGPSDLAGNRLLAPIDLVADGGLYSGFSFWSGAASPNSVGTLAGSCQDWSTSSAGALGLHGDANFSGGPDWFGNDSATDNTCGRIDVHLLCAEP